MSTLNVNTINAATSGQAVAVDVKNPRSFRNLIINGAMQVAQRGNSTSVGTSGYYGPDRFKYAEVSDAVFSISKSTESPDGFSSSYHMDCTTADTSVAATDYARILTVLEGQDVQAFAKGTSSAKKGVLSFYVKTNKTGTYSLFYFDSDNNRQFNATYTVSDSNWNRYTIEIPADTTGALTNDNNASIEIYWHLVAGSNRTTGSLDATWNTYTGTKEAAGHNVNFADSTSNDFYITGIQLEVGDYATDFEHRSYGAELARCQRYFQIQYGGSDAYIEAGKGQGTTSVDVGHALAVPLRAEPSITCPSNRVFRHNGYSDSTATPTVIQWSTTTSPLSSVIALNLSGHSGITSNYVTNWCPKATTLQLDSEL